MNISDAARALGRVKSKRKAETSRANGQKGGRPRRTEPDSFPPFDSERETVLAEQAAPLTYRSVPILIPVTKEKDSGENQ